MSTSTSAPQNIPDQALFARAMNEWQRRYIENPAQFEAEFNTIAAFRSDVAEGKEPSYGEVCTAYLEAIMSELRVAAEAP